MAVNDFTGKNIQDTYKRIVQTDGTNLADGTGSLLPISFDGNNVTISGSLTANEYIVSSSVTNITIATLSGSTEFGDTTDDTHTFTGHITASNNISSSRDIYGSTLYSAQGIMHDNDANTGITFSSDTLIVKTNTVQTAKFAGGTTQLGNTSYTTGITGSTISFKGHITASGNISARGNISSSGTITALSLNIGTIDGGYFGN